MEISEIANFRGLSTGTIYHHLEEAIINNLPLNFMRLDITLDSIDKLETVIRNSPINSNISK